jgi:hypothetical protein
VPSARGDRCGPPIGSDVGHDVPGQHDDVEPVREGEPARSPTIQRRPGAFDRAAAIMSASLSTPTAATPRRASSAATRLVPHPASSTERGA